VFSGEGGAAAGEIGIGAILGAPFLLATLAMFVTGVAAVVYRGRREQGAQIRCRAASVGDEFPWCKTPGKDVIVDQKTIARDVGFFLVFFAVAAAVGLVPLPLWLKAIAAVLLVAGYARYARMTLLSGGDLEGVPERLLALPRRPQPPLFAVGAQVLASLGVIVAGAHFFVDAVEHAAEGLGLPAGLIALVLAPLATELPEKFNSVFWIRDGKDTLSMGNITGAMIFQSTIPVTFGILFTPWTLGPLNLFAAGLALASGGLAYLMLRRSGKLGAGRLLIGGVFYLAFVAGAVMMIV
jgi:cation:H+ antiporter